MPPTELANARNHTTSAIAATTRILACRSRAINGYAASAASTNSTAATTIGSGLDRGKNPVTGQPAILPLFLSN